MKKIHFVILLGSCLSITFAAEPACVAKTFTPSQMIFPNPERGWIAHRYTNKMWGLDDLRNSVEKVSLVLLQINISDYRNVEHIGKEKLNEIRTALDECREQGLKVILRSAYAWDKILGPDPDKIETITVHVMDMKPIYKEFHDLIIAVETGMLGPWGELHSSKHSVSNTEWGSPIKTDALRAVHSAYMSALPMTRSVLFRRPCYIRQILGDDRPLEHREAYTNASKARTGYHNDAYLSSESDTNTFYCHGWPRDRELAYINQMTRYTFFGGETTGTPNGKYNNPDAALFESKRQHLTYLNRAYDNATILAWGSSVIEEFTRKLGYRFELMNLSHSQQVAPGGILDLYLNLRNSGFASMHLNRPVNLILDNGKAGIEQRKYVTTLTVDPRTWTPENGTISIHRKLRIPVSINQGTWQLLLALPDPGENLTGDARYAVRFANVDVWNDDGTNLLIKGLSITASAPGVRTTENVFQEVGTVKEVPLIGRLGAVRKGNSLRVTATYSKDYLFYQAFIDPDNNPATGYRVQGLGADILVENGNCYRYRGKQGSDWLWQSFKGAIKSSVKDRQYVWLLDISRMKPSIRPFSRMVFAGSNGIRANYSSIISVTTK